MDALGWIGSGHGSWWNGLLKSKYTKLKEPGLCRNSQKERPENMMFVLSIPIFKRRSIWLILMRAPRVCENQGYWRRLTGSNFSAQKKRV